MVVEGSPAAKNMEYLGLQFNELQLHEYLMEMECRYWPESLTAIVDARSRMYGLCGDLVAMTVADWIRGEREY